MEKGDYRKAIDLLQNLKREYLVFDYYTLSNSYLNINKLDSAIYFNNRIIAADSTNLEMAFKINRELGNKDLAIDNLEKEFNRQVNYYVNLTGENFLGIETNYYTTLALKNKSELITTKRVLLCIIAVFISLIIFLFWNYRRVIKNRKKQVKSYYILTQNLKKQLDDSIITKDKNYEILKEEKQKLESERRKTSKNLLIAQTKYENVIKSSSQEVKSLNDKIESLKNQLCIIEQKYKDVKNGLALSQHPKNDIVNNILRTEVKKRFDVLNKLCEAMYIANNSSEQTLEFENKRMSELKESRLLKRISNIINDFKFSESAYNELENIVDQGYNGIITKFKTTMPKLYKTYGDLYLYKCLSLPAVTIAYLLGTTEKSVYNRTYLLKLKIDKLAQNNKAELLKPIS